MGESDQNQPAIDQLTPGDVRISIVFGQAALVAQGPPEEVANTYDKFLNFLAQSVLMAKATPSGMGH